MPNLKSWPGSGRFPGTVGHDTSGSLRVRQLRQFGLDARRDSAPGPKLHEHVRQARQVPSREPLLDLEAQLAALGECGLTLNQVAETLD